MQQYQSLLCFLPLFIMAPNNSFCFLDKWWYWKRTHFLINGLAIGLWKWKKLWTSLSYPVALVLIVLFCFLGWSTKEESLDLVGKSQSSQTFPSTFLMRWKPKRLWHYRYNHITLLLLNFKLVVYNSCYTWYSYMYVWILKVLSNFCWNLMSSHDYFC